MTHASIEVATDVCVREASAADLASWDDLVSRFDNHRVVHKQAWIRSLESSGFGRPLYLIFAKGGEPVGCLPGLLVRYGVLNVFGSPLPGWQTVSMGPAFDPGRLTTGEMLSALLPFLENRHHVHHIEMSTSHLEADVMRAHLFRGEPVGTFRAPLFPEERDRSLRGLKESARRNVKRGVKLGLVTRFVDDESFVDEHFAQLKEVYIRGGYMIPFGRERVLACFRHLRDSGNLVAVSVQLPNDGACIATGMFTVEGKELLLWTWAHRGAYRWYRATELMTWTVMQRAMDAGCNTFDLMGRGDFKAKFGALPEATKYRWVRSRYRWLTHARDAAEKMFRWQQAVRGRIARYGANGSEPAARESEADHEG